LRASSAHEAPKLELKIAQHFHKGNLRVRIWDRNAI
jgi:hypothetical protein